MRDRDIEELESILKTWVDDGCFETPAGRAGSIRSIVTCSADGRESRTLKQFFPGSQIEDMTSNQWNLDEACPSTSDMVLACNVFMCARDPKRWIENACRKTRFFVMLDNCVSHRGNVEGETSPSTGDFMRYTMPPHMEAMLPESFDLNRVADRLISLHPYEMDSGCGVTGYDKTKMFVALFRGDL